MCQRAADPFCDLNEPEGGAFLRLYTADAMIAAAACFDATCEDFEGVDACLGSVFNFGTAEEV